MNNGCSQFSVLDVDINKIIFMINLSIERYIHNIEFMILTNVSIQTHIQDLPNKNTY